MPHRQPRHPAQRGRDSLRLESTPEAASSRVSTPRVDSVSPGSLAGTPPKPAPTTKYGASWTFYSRNSSLERKRKLAELTVKYGFAKAEAEASTSEESLGSSLDEFSNFMDYDEDDNKAETDTQSAHGEEVSGNPASNPSLISLLSLLSLPPSHPFHGTTTTEQRQMYWDSLPTYSGASLPVGAQSPSFASFPTPPLPSSPSSSTLNPAAEENENAGEDDVVESERRRAICDEERPIISIEGKGKAKLLDTLCCRAQAGTPVSPSRLPIRIGTAVPGKKKYKFKTGLVRMPLDPRDELGGGSSLSSNGVPSRSRTSLPYPDQHDEGVSPLPAPSLSTGDSKRNERSVEERLRNTTLDDLPMSQQDAEDVRELMAELVRDREGMSGTWPPRSRRGAGMA